MRFSHEFLEDLKTRLTLSDIVGRKVKLTRRGREFSGLCPFHNEKTPSFTLNDQKGFYHCFGCGMHGSAIDFVMETEGLEFVEAIERLAGEAGMALPKITAEDVEKQKKRSTLYEVMEQVCQWFETQLKSQAGADASVYVNKRGLTAETVKMFRLGYAPSSRTALKEAMLARDIDEDQLIATGMLIAPEGGGPSYDRFRNRLMFPIMDIKGRIIAFGGRALEADAKAKYLNSPETDLFHKGYNLYNLKNARQAAFDVGTILVVEGYMDVIALAQFGIPYAVAPLGTALTEDQMRLLWRVADEPVLSFDGDNAGQRAAVRAAERGLPLLVPGKSLRFVILPAGEDPDSLVQKHGREAMERLIDKAAPLVDTIWAHLILDADISTPERRAGLEKKVFGFLNDIEDDNVKKLYRSEFGRRLRDIFWQAQQTERGKKYSGKTKTFLPTRQTNFKKTPIALGAGEKAVTERMEQILVLTMVNHPQLLATHLEEFVQIELSQPPLMALKDAIVDMASEHDFLDAETMQSYLNVHDLWPEVSRLKTRCKDDWFAHEEAALADAETGFAHTLSRFMRIGPALRELKAAEADFSADMTEKNQTRFLAAKQAFEALLGTESDIKNYGLASNRLSDL